MKRNVLRAAGATALALFALSTAPVSGGSLDKLNRLVLDGGRVPYTLTEDSALSLRAMKLAERMTGWQRAFYTAPDGFTYVGATSDACVLGIRTSNGHRITGLHLYCDN